jgi:hypothetical protein
VPPLPLQESKKRLKSSGNVRNGNVDFGAGGSSIASGRQCGLLKLSRHDFVPLQSLERRRCLCHSLARFLAICSKFLEHSEFAIFDSGRSNVLFCNKKWSIMLCLMKWPKPRSLWSVRDESWCTNKSWAAFPRSTCNRIWKNSTWITPYCWAQRPRTWKQIARRWRPI